MELIKNVCVEGRPGWNIVLQDGVITAMGAEVEAPADATIIDGGGAVAIPGLLDTHVHFREPGLTDKGCIATESAAAVAGGVTAFIDMPNTKPATLTPEALEHKYALAAASSRADYGFFLGACEATPELLDRIPRALLPGVKLFMGTTTGAVATPSDAALDRLFRVCAERDLPIVVHAEDDALIAANAAAAAVRYGSREAVPVSEHAAIRSRQACLKATSRAVELAHRFGTRLHIAHVSTREEVEEFLTPGPVEGKTVTAETTPMYLDPEFGRTPTTWRTKINPAVKTEADAAVLREAVFDGRIDTIGTDHAPHLRTHKQGGEFTAASGAPSLQFALPVMLGYLPLDAIVRCMCANPAAIFAVQRPVRLAVGARTQVVLIDKLTEPKIIADADVLTPAAWTPFAGRCVDYAVRTVPFRPERLFFGC